MVLLLGSSYFYGGFDLRGIILSSALHQAKNNSLERAGQCPLQCRNHILCRRGMGEKKQCYEWWNSLSLLKQIKIVPTFLALLSYAKAISRLWAYVRLVRIWIIVCSSTPKVHIECFFNTFLKFFFTLSFNAILYGCNYKPLQHFMIIRGTWL